MFCAATLPSKGNVTERVWIYSFGSAVSLHGGLARLSLCWNCTSGSYRVTHPKTLFEKRQPSKECTLLWPWFIPPATLGDSFQSHFIVLVRRTFTEVFNAAFTFPPVVAQVLVLCGRGLVVTISVVLTARVLPLAGIGSTHPHPVAIPYCVLLWACPPHDP